MKPTRPRAFATVALIAALAGCGAPDPSTPPEPVSERPAPTAAPGEPRIREESGPGWGFRAEWPAALERYPALLAAVEADVAAARKEIEAQAAPGDAPAGADSEPMEGQDPSWPPVETQMNWSIAVETPTLVSAVLEGYTYAGGAHGLPLHAVHHLDPTTGRLLDPAELFATEAGWQALAERVRAVLYARVDEQLADTEPEFVEDARKGGREWIDEGTQPGPSHLGLFIPQAGAGGAIETLLFVFPPYQVGPYAEGTHSVAIPVADLRPLLSPRWANALGVPGG